MHHHHHHHGSSIPTEQHQLYTPTTPVTVTPTTPTATSSNNNFDFTSITGRTTVFATQCHENDIAKLVLVHEPGTEALIGSLHASGSLFEKPVNLAKAREDHARFRKAMENRGVRVLTVREVLAMYCDENLRYRAALEELALEVLQYKLYNKPTHQLATHNNSGIQQQQQQQQPTQQVSQNTTNVVDLTKVQQHLLSDDYKRQCLSKMGTHDLIELIMLGPTCGLVPSHENTPLRLDNLQMKPLLNLTFTRDQQIITNRGLVLMNMGSTQRLRETKLMNFCFNKLNVPILGKIDPPGTCEGGDFIAAGADLCFIGTGLRTNQTAIDQLLQNDWFGTRRVAVCRDLFDCDQQRMHLDTVFNICSQDCAIMLDTMIGEQSPIRRLVTEYTQIIDKNTGRKEYIVTKKDIEMSKYVRDEGYHIIPISQEQQAAYGINFLNLGNGFLVCADESTARTILKSEYFDGDIQVIDFSGMITMFGCLHCCSQVLQRIPSNVNSRHHTPQTKKFVHPAEFLVTNDSNQLCKNVLLVSPSYYDPVGMVAVKQQKHDSIGGMIDSGADLENASRSRPLNPINLNGMNRSRSTSPDGNRRRSSPTLKSFQHSVSNVLNSDQMADKSLNQSFSHLDGVLSVHNVNRFLFAQYTNDKKRDAVFAAHNMTTIDGKCILFPVPAQRSGERKQGVLELMTNLYNGRENIISLEKNLVSNHGRFHGGNIVLDRLQSCAYLLLVEGTEYAQEIKESVVECMKQIGFTTHYFAIKKQDSNDEIEPRAYLRENANSVVFAGSKFALVCSDLLTSVEEADKLKLLLTAGDRRKVFEISLEQQSSNAINGVVELADEADNSVLLYSESGWGSLTEDVQEEILELVATVEALEMKSIEDINGGSLNDMVVTLY